MAKTRTKTTKKPAPKRSRARSRTSRPRSTGGKSSATKAKCSTAHATTVAKPAADPETSSKTPRPVVARPASTSDQLGSYFQGMSQHALLTPDQEKQMAREIERNKIEVWELLLNNPAIAEHVIDQLEMRLPKPLEESRQVREAAAMARRSRSKLRRSQLAEIAGTAATSIRAQDLDRVHVDALLEHLRELRRGTGSARNTKLSFSPRSRTYIACLESAMSCNRKAAQLRRDFVHANLRLVVTMARRYEKRGMSLADLIQEGNLGLMHSIGRFDPGRGLRFSTYACWWIRHALGRAVADKSRTVRIPVHMLEAQAQLYKVQQKLTRDLDRKPSPAELATAARMPERKVEQMHQFLMGGAMSLDRPMGANDDRPMKDVLTDPESERVTAEDVVSTQSVTDRMYDVMIDKLSPIEAAVISRRFGLRDDRQRTFREIGDEYQLSRERIRQIQNRALGKLREALRKAV